MKRIILLLLFAVLLLAACGETEQAEVMTQPVTFYYRTAKTDYAAEDGVIRAETRDLGTDRYTDQKLFELYFGGPLSSELVSPFSQDTVLSVVLRRGSTLEIMLTQNAHSPSEFDHNLAYACLAKTGLALDGIHKVRIKVRSRGGAVGDDVMLTADDMLLYDNGEDPEQNQEVTLYYADESGRFLLTEKRTVPMMKPEELQQNAKYVLELLLSAPQSGGMRMALPTGTAILDDVSVENGICSVDFNEDFFTNRPEGEQTEQLTILSVVNTLCELNGINQVQIYSQGRKLTPYVWLSLSEPWLMDTSVVGPIREELGEFAGTLCLPGKSDDLLHRLTVRTRARGNATQEEALLMALLARSSQNGLRSPFSSVSVPLSVATSNQICTVELAEHTLPTDLDARETALRSIVATLTSLPEVDAVRILEDGIPVSFEPMTPSDDWFCAQPDSDDSPS